MWTKEPRKYLTLMIYNNKHYREPMSYDVNIRITIEEFYRNGVLTAH